jgi:hypothetical protein
VSTKNLSWIVVKAVNPDFIQKNIGLEEKRSYSIVVPICLMGLVPELLVNSKICTCSRPFYKMMLYLHIEYIHILPHSLIITGVLTPNDENAM